MAAPTTPGTELTPDLIDRVRKLFPQSKDKLVGLLLDELEGPPDDPEEVRKAWKDEIARRIEDIQAGRAQLLDADEALDRIEQKLRERRGQ